LQCKDDQIRVLLEGPIDIPFKAVGDAYNAVKDLDCEIWIVSSSGKPKPDWRYNRFFEKVPIHEMKKIYSSCDIFLKMSKVEGFFGPPMEAMACGCAVVVGKVTGYDEYIRDGVNALVVEMGDVEGAGKAVQRLILDRALRNNLIDAGYETVKNWTWQRSIGMLEKVLSYNLNGG
jgi:glycosyltransferase involved in cell wall biosynthesis